MLYCIVLCVCVYSEGWSCDDGCGGYCMMSCGGGLTCTDVKTEKLCTACTRVCSAGIAAGELCGDGCGGTCGEDVCIECVCDVCCLCGA